MKKDGATHTISRYFVVPKDYQANKANGSQIVTTTITSNSRYAKSMDANVNASSAVNATFVSLKEETNEKNPLNSKRLNSDGSYTIKDIDIRGKQFTNNLVRFSLNLTSISFK